jgi:hypothetical protein
MNTLLVYPDVWVSFSPRKPSGAMKDDVRTPWLSRYRLVAREVPDAVGCRRRVLRLCMRPAVRDCNVLIPVILWCNGLDFEVAIIVVRVPLFDRERCKEFKMRHRWSTFIGLYKCFVDDGLDVLDHSLVGSTDLTKSEMIVALHNVGASSFKMYLMKLLRLRGVGIVENQEESYLCEAEEFCLLRAVQ